MKICRCIYLISIAIILTVLTACAGKDSEKRGDIPAKRIVTHGDSIALAARFSGDFEHFLAVTDSLAEIGELSPIRAEGYRGVAYFHALPSCLSTS